VNCYTPCTFICIFTCKLNSDAAAKKAHRTYGHLQQLATPRQQSCFFSTHKLVAERNGTICLASCGANIITTVERCQQTLSSVQFKLLSSAVSQTFGGCVRRIHPARPWHGTSATRSRHATERRRRTKKNGLKIHRAHCRLDADEILGRRSWVM